MSRYRFNGEKHYANADIENGKIIARVDGEKTYKQYVLHEVFHDFAERNPIVLYQMRERIKQQYSAQEFRDVADMTVRMLRGVIDISEDMTEDEKRRAMLSVEEEICADAFSGINGFATDANKFAEWMTTQGAQELADATENAEAESGSSAGARYSIKNTSQMSLAEQLKRYYDGKMRSSDAFYFGETPQNINKSGEESVPLTMTISDFEKSTKIKHNIPRRVLKNLLENLTHPLFSFSDGDRIGIVIDDIDGGGKKVVVCIHYNSAMDRKSVNTIESIYGIENPKQWIGNQIQNGKSFVVYDKKRANDLLQTYGYLALVGEDNRSLIERVPQKTENVNSDFSKNAENAENSKKSTAVTGNGMPVASVEVLGSGGRSLTSMPVYSEAELNEVLSEFADKKLNISLYRDESGDAPAITQRLDKKRHTVQTTEMPQFSAYCIHWLICCSMDSSR